MANAMKEFLEAIKGRQVKAAYIRENHFSIDEVDQKAWYLQVGYTPEQCKAFLNSIDFIYDAGFGSQELEGIIWFEDGTWCSRGEYDGSEWWEHNECPEIHMNCKTTFDTEAPLKRIN